MEDMIARIVEMDKKARDMTDEAIKSKLDYEQKIIQTKERIKNDYLERAKKRISVNQQTAQKKADEKLILLKEKNSTIIKELENTCRENFDEWVEQIVARVVGE